jgi:hypothetical protein
MLTFGWSNKVEVCMQSGLHRTFKGPQEAAAFLEYEWPFRHGTRYEQAVKTCYAAMDSNVPAALARAAFLEACREANLTVTAAD